MCKGGHARDERCVYMKRVAMRECESVRVCVRACAKLGKLGENAQHVGDVGATGGTGADVRVCGDVGVVVDVYNLYINIYTNTIPKLLCSYDFRDH
jgi:hypothetical protein